MLVCHFVFILYNIWSVVQLLATMSTVCGYYCRTIICSYFPKWQLTQVLVLHQINFQSKGTAACFQALQKKFLVHDWNWLIFFTLSILFYLSWYLSLYYWVHPTEYLENNMYGHDIDKTFKVYTHLWGQISRVEYLRWSNCVYDSLWLWKGATFIPSLVGFVIAFVRLSAGWEKTLLQE